MVCIFGFRVEHDTPPFLLRSGAALENNREALFAPRIMTDGQCGVELLLCDAVSELRADRTWFERFG